MVSLCLLAGPPASSAQDGQSSWRETLERFERGLDDLLDELAGLEDGPETQLGLFVPARADAAAAKELPNSWVSLASVESPPRRLVLLVHGLDEPGDIWSDLAPALVEAGHPVARFEYPNDQRIHASAGQLLASLRDARLAGVEEIAIIGHSMGGLVSFDALTREDGYAGNPRGHQDLPRVTRLIAVGTPWAGSPWARLRAAAEVREQVQRWLMSESWDIRPIINYRRDGKGQAGDDLAEGSQLIRELAKRPMPQGLPFTVIAGHIPVTDEAFLDWIQTSKVLRQIMGADGVTKLTEDLREAWGTLGDGAVPLNSALARPAEDTHVFEVNHRALIRRSPIDFITGSDPAGPPGIPVILERLTPPSPGETPAVPHR